MRCLGSRIIPGIIDIPTLVVALAFGTDHTIVLAVSSAIFAERSVNIGMRSDTR